MYKVRACTYVCISLYASYRISCIYIDFKEIDFAVLNSLPGYFTMWPGFICFCMKKEHSLPEVA